MNVECCECTQCGAPLFIGAKQCRYCKSPVVITTFSPLKMKGQVRRFEKAAEEEPDDVESRKTLGLSCLLVKNYDRALQIFDEVLEMKYDDGEAYFMKAAALLRGKSPYMTHISVIRQITEQLESACECESRGIYWYFRAYVAGEFYARKKLRAKPDWQQCLQEAVDAGLPQGDIDTMFGWLGAEQPGYLRI